MIKDYKCSLCNSKGVNASTCPENYRAQHPNYSAHYLAMGKNFNQNGKGLRNPFKKNKPSEVKTIPEIKITKVIKLPEPKVTTIKKVSQEQINDEKALKYFGEKYDDLWQADQAFINSYISPKNIYESFRNILMESVRSPQDQDLVDDILEKIIYLSHEDQDILFALTAYQTYGVEAGLASRGDKKNMNISSVADLAIAGNTTADFRKNLIDQLGM